MALVPKLGKEQIVLLVRKKKILHGFKRCIIKSASLLEKWNQSTPFPYCYFYREKSLCICLMCSMINIVIFLYINTQIYHTVLALDGTFTLMPCYWRHSYTAANDRMKKWQPCPHFKILLSILISLYSLFPEVMSMYTFNVLTLQLAFFKKKIYPTTYYFFEYWNSSFRPWCHFDYIRIYPYPLKMFPIIYLQRFYTDHTCADILTIGIYYPYRISLYTPPPPLQSGAQPCGGSMCEKGKLPAAITVLLICLLIC